MSTFYTKKIIARKHVTFNENVIPFLELSSSFHVSNVSSTFVINRLSHFPVAKTTMFVSPIHGLMKNLDSSSLTSSPIMSPTNPYCRPVISFSTSKSHNS